MNTLIGCLLSHAMPCYAMLCCAVLHCATLCHAVQCRTAPHCAALCHAVPCCAMLCNGMACHVVPCCGMVCHAIRRQSRHEGGLRLTVGPGTGMATSLSSLPGRLSAGSSTLGRFVAATIDSRPSMPAERNYVERCILRSAPIAICKRHVR